MDADDFDDLKKVVFFGCRTEEETKRDVVVVVVDANNADALVFIVVLRKTSVEKRGDTSVDNTTLYMNGKMKFLCVGQFYPQTL